MNKAKMQEYMEAVWDSWAEIRKEYPGAKLVEMGLKLNTIMINVMKGKVCGSITYCVNGLKCSNIVCLEGYKDERGHDEVAAKSK